MNLLQPKALTALLLFFTTVTTANSEKQKIENNNINKEKIEQVIVAKVTQAYGGKKLTSLKSIAITEYNKMISPGQGESPKQPGFFRINEVLTIDFGLKRKSLLSWRVSRTSKDLEKSIFDGHNGRIYDILNNKYAQEDWLTFQSTGSAVTRRSDTMIARALSEQSTTISYQGESVYLGAIHQKIKAKIGSGAEYTLFIDKNLGFISKMVRQHPRAGEISYAFSNHQQSAGITFAQDLNFTVAGQTRLVSLDRKITLNPDLNAAFAIPEEYSNWGESFDSSKLVVKKLANNVYHAGKGRSFTLFINSDDYFIASGGHSGLTEAFKAVKDFSGIEKPLKFIISTHHHSEHIPSLREATALGAKIITVEQHLSALKKDIPEEHGKEHFSIIKDKATLGNGAVEVYDIATMHADNYLLVYVPAAKLVFAEDHFETQLKVAVPRVHKDMLMFRKAMEALPIDVEFLIDGHSPRLLSITEFNEATNNYQDVICPVAYNICNKG